MRVKILSEHGYDEAMLGLSLSYNQPIEKMENVAIRLAPKDGGHNKFLESIFVWVDIVAPRYWWQQFDAYRIGVTKQSESTMHTLVKRPLTQNDFSEVIPAWYMDYLNNLIEEKRFFILKSCLPEGFLQRRIVCLNYKSIRHIMKQRGLHKLFEWREFCLAMVNGLKHGELIRDISIAESI